MFNPDPSLVTLLQATVAAGASDLHLTVGRPPSARRDGTLVPFEGVGVLDMPETERMVMSLLDDEQKRELAEVRQVDFSFGVEGLGRFRANAFNQRGSYALALRVVPYRVRSLEELGAPWAATELLNKPFGLVLVVGPTGSGKSTTLAAMIDRINATKPLHILTIEDPVEYLHDHKMAMVNQREVGTDVNSFTDGLRSALREDPDVILLGEMRDLDSISITLTLAETGHLVFATPAHQRRLAGPRPHRRRVPRRASRPDPDPARRFAAGRHQPASATRRQRRSRRCLRGADGQRRRPQPVA